MSTTKQFPPICRAPVVALVALIAAACACSTEGVVPTTTVPTSSVVATQPATSAPPDLLHDVDAVLQTDRAWEPEMMEAIRDYVRAQQAFVRAASDPVNPEDPELLVRFVSDAQRARRDALSNAKTSGRAAKAPKVFVLRPEKTGRIDASTVSVTLCLTAQVPFVDIATGELLDDSEFSDRTEAQLTKSADGWAVAKETQLGIWDGGSCQ